MNRKWGYIKTLSIGDSHLSNQKRLNFTIIYGSCIIDKHLFLLVNNYDQVYSAFIDIDDLKTIIMHNIQQQSGNAIKSNDVEKKTLLCEGYRGKYVILLVKTDFTKLFMISPIYGLINPILNIDEDSSIIADGSLIIYRDSKYSDAFGYKYYVKTFDGNFFIEIKDVSSRVYSFTLSNTTYVTYSTSSKTTSVGDVLNILTNSKTSGIIIYGPPIVFEYIDPNNIRHQYNI